EWVPVVPDAANGTLAWPAPGGAPGGRSGGGPDCGGGVCARRRIDRPRTGACPDGAIAARRIAELAVPHADTGPFAGRRGRCRNRCRIPFGIPNGADVIRPPTARGVRRLPRTCERPGYGSAAGRVAFH